MRLVCDKCDAVYSIDDALVGTRDFRVSCKSCGRPIVVKSARQVVTERVAPKRPSLPPPSALASAIARPQAAVSEPEPPPIPESSGGPETWYVLDGERQLGPHTAQQLARMFEQGRIEWGTEVWREGLKGWRPARRDALLVTAVAGARGVANDTTRLDAARSFLAPEDTVVETRPPMPERLRAESPADADDSTDSKLPKLHRNPLAQDPTLDLRPSVRPQAWHSAQNAAFREALGLPTDSSQVPSQAPAKRLADAFHSAPSLLAGHSTERSWFDSWIQRSTSLILVGVISFGAGALATVGWGHVTGAREVVSAPPVSAQLEESRPATPSAPVLTPSTSAQTTPRAAAEPAPVALRELPTADEMRGEIRKVTADVKRCVEDPAAGVDVDIYLDGPTGRVRDVDVKSALITPGRVACITQAVRRMQLAPFARSELKLMHKFSW